MARQAPCATDRQGKPLVDLWQTERDLRVQGYQFICGVDEAGAGPLAGAVYAGSVILPPELYLEGLDDSKKLTAKTRDRLFDQICAQAVAWAVGWADEGEIDATDILSARMLAMQRAIDKLSPAAEFALVDGNRDHGKHACISTPHQTLVKGDGRSASIAAASILAKVSRDRYMVEMGERYPQYGFAQHKGYGTRLHYEALRKYGPCAIHRRTFLKNL